jgi:hypothetical protein
MMHSTVFLMCMVSFSDNLTESFFLPFFRVPFIMFTGSPYYPESSASECAYGSQKLFAGNISVLPYPLGGKRRHIPQTPSSKGWLKSPMSVNCFNDFY